MKKRKMKLWIWLLIAALVIGAGITAAVLLPKVNREPVYVYGFMDGTAGMSDYYDGGRESSGMVETDRVQNVFLSGTQEVTEILVSDGQSVSKGDVLFTYDTTLSDLALQQKDLSLQQARLDLQTAHRELAVINSYVPISYHPVEKPEEEEEEELPQLSDFDLEGKDYLAYAGKGDTSLTPRYCWLRSTAMVDEALIAALFEDYEEDSLYVIFQHTDEDENDTEITEEFGLKLARLKLPASPETPEIQENVYRFAFFDPMKVQQEQEPEDDGIDWNSGFTVAEIAAMRQEKQKQIKDMEFQIKMAEAELKIMQKEADDGAVTAEFDGTVTGLLMPEEAVEMGMPLMKISGGGGFYVTGSVSELELHHVQPGQIVDVMSWDTGMMYEGTVVEVQPFPQTQDEMYYYGGQQNSSYYPYKVFIDESAMLQDGFYVSMTLRAGESQGSLYINNAFVRTEGAASYVYVRGENGLLEKRYLKLGGLLWGEYSQVVSGLTAEDFVAFPYGKQIKEGAPTVEGTWENLMGY